MTELDLSRLPGGQRLGDAEHLWIKACWDASHLVRTTRRKRVQTRA